MKGERCCICDGPIVNGRCKLCGMPYQKNEELYHVNEEREVHMLHASQAVREALREREIPLGDKIEEDEPVPMKRTDSNRAHPIKSQNISRNISQNKGVGSGTASGSNASGSYNRLLLVLAAIIILIVLINILFP